MNLEKLTVSQKRALAIVTAVALLFGFYFLRHFFILIVVAGISAFLFSPLYKRFKRRMGSGLAAALTFLSALLIVILPLIGIIALAIFQVSHMINGAAQTLQGTDMGALGNSIVNFINDILSRIPYVNYQVSSQQLTDNIASIAQSVGNWLLGFLASSASSVLGVVTSSIIYIYVFISFLVNQDKLLSAARKLNPLGDQISDMYLAKTGAMVKGTVGGQFVIAICQGVAGAISIYLAGFHEGFFLFAIFLTLLSVIPLGSGIVTIPFGIGMMLFGNIAGGIFVIAWHILVITNIDNLLRPILVPQQARLDPALMLLSVFAGISMFGFWGIVIGPVIMILVVTTVRVYLAVFKGVPLVEHPPKQKRKLPFLKKNSSSKT